MTAIRPILMMLVALSALALEPEVPIVGLDAEADAAARYVSTSGNDSNSGSLSAPWRTLQFASGRLSPGDTLYVRGGVYYERPTIAANGTAAARIVFTAYPGEAVTIDSGTPDFRVTGNSDWELVNASLGEYRSVRTFSNSNTYGYLTGIPGYQNGRVALVPYVSAPAFRAVSDQYVDTVTPFYVGPGTFFDAADQRLHIRLARTSDVRATELRYGAIFGIDAPDPRQFSILISQASTTLRVTGSYLVFLRLTVNQALNSVQLDASAHHVTFDDMTVWLGDSAIESRGAHDLLITRSRVYGDAPYWLFWSDMKDPPAPADKSRGTSIDLRSGTRDVVISYCHVRGCGQDLVGTNENETNIEVHHCRLENATDDAFELEGTTDVGRISIHDNYILNCLVAVAPGQDSPAYTGPLLVYRNVIAQLRSTPINRKAGINTWNGGNRYGFEYMFKHGRGATDITRNAHYYHNTLVLLNSGGKGLNWIPKDPTDCRIANNIAISINGVVNRDYFPASGEVVNGNLYWKRNSIDGAPLLASYTTVPAFSAATGFEVNGLGSAPRRGTDPRLSGFSLVFADTTQTRWEPLPISEVPKLTDFLLAAGSPAIGAGIVIPSHPTLGPLPDSRSSRDLGAFPYGTTVSELSIYPFQLDTTPPSAPYIRLGP